MRILKLTPAVEKQLARMREGQHREASAMASKIVADVRRHGDAALFHWTRKLDRVDLAKRALWISPAEMAAAGKRVSHDFVRAVRHAAANVRRVSASQMPRPWSLQVEPGVNLTQLIRPIDSVGCYIPGGRFALFSTMIMTVVPAQVAGVHRIVVVCPAANDEVLATAAILGVKHFARIGGAQAVAALAYGTGHVLRVEKIFGPGNRYVTAAKQIVSSDCAIDLPAGPTEAIVLARNGNARWIASDLLAQAEHAPDAGSYLVTPSASLAQQVRQEVETQLKLLPPTNPAHSSCRKTGAILLTRSWSDAIDFVNRFAPEHLSVPESSAALLNKLTAAGTIFAGPIGAQPFGDYATGSNHVLPTGAWARRRGGLAIDDFLKRISVQTIDRTGFRRLANDVRALANAEGLLAHANAVEVRR
jgi:histidinol dehydrogenase